MSRIPMTKEEFITKARKKHGNKYDYSMVDKFKDSKEKVLIKCNKCGNVFPQRVNDHLNGHGCPMCAKRQSAKAASKVLRMTNKEFVEKAKAKHGDKYDYSLVKINGNNKTKVKITCNTCGTVFEQSISNHLSGKGCPNCAVEARKRVMPIEEFIAKSIEKHRDKYDYSLVEIKGNNKTKVKIKCNACETIFDQRINDHLNGHGCPMCAKTDTLEEFIAKAKAVHGDKYGYDNVIYKGDKEKVMITCPIHGDFPQTPHSHKKGCGCPSCNQSHLESKTALLLEKNNIIFDTQKRFSWLKSNKNWTMPLDFYLTEYNTAIECQGMQHYECTNNGFFTNEIVNEIKQRDTLKYNLCKEHGIPIFYIRYDENVETKINNILNKISFKHHGMRV